MQKRDYYEILGVKKDASDEELKKAFRKQSLLYHPDRQHGKSEEEKKIAEEKFKECAEAYECLSNKEKRSQYDTFGHDGMNQNGGFGGQNIDPREFFRRHMQGFGFGGGFGDFDDFSRFGFGSHNNSRKNDPNAPEDGKTISLRIRIRLEDVLYGIKRDFDIDIEDHCEHCKGTGSEDGKTSNCPTCNGTGMYTQRQGMMIMQSTCPTCHGSGHKIDNPCKCCNGSGIVSSKRHLEFEIPMGLADGESLIIKGQGQKGKNGGNTGDVLIYPIIAEHEVFKRNGLNLGIVLNVPSITAILGGDVDVQTPWGAANLKIPSGTVTGKVFKMKNMGMHSKNGNGNLEVVVNVENISNLSNEQKEILEKLRDTVTEDNYKETKERNDIMKEFEKRSSKLRKDS